MHESVAALKRDLDAENTKAIAEKATINKAYRAAKAADEAQRRAYDQHAATVARIKQLLAALAALGVTEDNS